MAVRPRGVDERLWLAQTAAMGERIGGRTGLGPGGQVTNAMLATAELRASGLEADGADCQRLLVDDGMVHVEAGTVCMACFRFMTARQAARRCPDGWRHESCP